MTRERGFTLLEVLVALVVFGFLMVGLTQGVRFGLSAWTRQEKSIDARSDLDAVDRTLRTLITQLDPAGAVSGKPHGMAFTAPLPEPAGEADLLLLVDPRHRLILRWTRHLHAVRFSPPVAQEIELLGGVDRLDLAYWPPDGAGGWADAWDKADPPALIRVRLAFPSGDPRHWPDIVAAPMRERLGR
jgi:general secretion pathway protein J